MIVPDWSSECSPQWGDVNVDGATEHSTGLGAISLQQVSAGYDGEQVIEDLTLEVGRGEFVFVEGPSGAGKTTLLRLLYGIIRPSEGSAVVDGADLARLSERQLARFRRGLGCVFQSYELLPHLTALENVRLPLELARADVASPTDLAVGALNLVGLADKCNSRPDELSGGQQQRVTIARAIAHEPRILLADEPTGNLDSAATDAVMEAFESYHERGGTVVMATHDETLRERHAKRVIRMLTSAA